MLLLLGLLTSLLALNSQAEEIHPDCKDGYWMNNTELADYIQSIAEHDLAMVYSIGKSVEGQELWAVRLTATEDDQVGVPEVKLIGNIHGNEPLGRQLLVYFIELLFDNYKNGEKYTKWLLDNTRIHILPAMNPDGFSRAYEGDCATGPGRQNAHDEDLNRGFPDPKRTDVPSMEPEAEAMISWMQVTHFVLSASFHGGALVANYPYDANWNADLIEEHATPDNDVFVHLASRYASVHHGMSEGEGCGRNDGFRGGIVNGAAWYPVVGGMQDFNYIYHGTLELTLELGCCKYPKAENLCQHWEENRNAMLLLVGEAQRGVKGVVVDDETKEPIRDAQVSVLPRNVTSRTTSRGEYWKVLLPGRYFIKVEAEGYKTKISEVIIPQPKSTTKFEPVIFNMGLEAGVDIATEALQPTTEATIRKSASTSKATQHHAQYAYGFIALVLPVLQILQRCSH